MTSTVPLVAHPLDPLQPEELAAAVAAIRAEHDPQRQMRFVTVALAEPDKGRVLAWRDGEQVERLAEVVVLDPPTEGAYEALVDVERSVVREWRRLPGGVQPALAVEEYELCEEVVRAHPDFQSALRRRGLRDEEFHLVTIDPVPAGNFGYEEEVGRRVCRALAWLRPDEDGNSYARPLEGIVGLVDLHRGEVIRIEDHGVTPIPPGTGEYRAGRTGLPFREDLKPIEITQPDGASFEVDGNLVRWQRWSFRVGFTAREGLVLHQVGYEDGGRVRPVLYRGSFCEMAVPYGDPSPTRYIQGPFDIGENCIGTLANALELGCDCLGLIHYFDAHVVNSKGDVVTKPNAVCMHEEDVGLLWKHWDFRNGQTEVRRSRRLVISSISTVGNYEYGFFWHLYQDGSIEVEVKLTGILSTAAVAPGTQPTHGTLVDVGLNAMNHQHFFSVRLDLDVDGLENSIYEVHTEPTAREENPYGNAFHVVRTPLRSELEAQRDIDPLAARTWLIANPGRLNAWGAPTAYRLVPGETVKPFAQPGSPLPRRAAFTLHSVWATPYEPRERYAAGEYPNQHAGGAGLPEWTARDRSLEDVDVVLWYTMGHHHVPRPEDWPVMPVWRMGFHLKPDGFFDRNPSLDVAPPAGHCH
jgi:primary-amine oxidase